MINAPFTHCAGCCNYYNGVCNSIEKCPHQGGVVQVFDMVGEHEDIVPQSLVMPKIEINEMSMVDMLNKAIEESPIYKATIDFEAWHVAEQKELAEYISKETAREIFKEIEQRIYDRRYDAKAILREVKFYELAKEYGIEVEDDQS